MKRRSKVGGKRANAKDRKSVKRATKLGEPVSSRVPLYERPAELLLQLLKADHEQARACNRIARLGPDRGEGARLMADRGKQAAASDMPSRRRAHRPANAFAATAIGHSPPDYKISCRSPREAHAHAFALCDGRLGRGRVLSLQWADDGSVEISPKSPAPRSGTLSATPPRRKLPACSNVAAAPRSTSANLAQGRREELLADAWGIAEVTRCPRRRFRLRHHRRWPAQGPFFAARRCALRLTLGLLMLARDLVGQFGTWAFRFQLQLYAASRQSLRSLTRAIWRSAFVGVDFADLDETKMRLPGTIA